MKIDTALSDIAIKEEVNKQFIEWRSRYTAEGVVRKNKRVYAILNCKYCSQDKELWYKGSIETCISNIKEDMLFCGCSRSVYWSEQQYKILINRRCVETGYVFKGFANKFKDSSTTRLKLYNPITCNYWDNHSIKDYLRIKKIDPVEGHRRGSIKKTKPLNICLKEIKDRLRKLEGEFIEINGNYDGSKTYFSWKCKHNHPCKTRISKFLNDKSGCDTCRKINSGFYGYYPDRADEKDYLYILNFDGNYIKVGRSFDVKERVKSLKRESGIKNITLIKVFTATHQEVYDTEQWFHTELEERGFYHHDSVWSIETFHVDCLPVIEHLIQFSDMKEV